MFPNRVVTSNNSVCTHMNILSASLTSGLNFNTAVNDGNLRTADDYKEWPGASLYAKKYIGVDKYLKRAGKPRWYPCLNPPADLELTMFRIYGAGYANAAGMARMKATWYVKFKSFLL